MFTKLLIANRGEIAVRIIHTCRAMGIKTVGVYSDADAHALHVRLADEAIHIGAAPSAESYLQGARIIAAALETGCAAVHPGYGFLSENAAFAQAVRAAGLVYIAPPADAIRQMGSKTEARHLMQSAGVPVVPGYQGTGGDLATEAERIGYPVLVKAAAGGGGKGMRVVETPADLPEALASARREAANAFGDDTVFLEKYLPIAHHIEFQILADAHGNTVHLFERECSIQRRHQKIVEETPSPLLDDALRAQMGAAAVAAATAVGYQNAGTVEFIVDENRHFYFLEMNTRLQVEHPITEAVTGLDLVELQIRIAAGEKLPFSQADLHQRGHAIECRIYAEDPANDFLPAIGAVLLAQLPNMPGVRVDTGVGSGDVVSIHYDPMIAKLVVYGASREAAIRRMQAALRAYVILGVTTNIPFLAAVMAHPAFWAGETPTDFIPRYLANWQPPTSDTSAMHLALIGTVLGMDSTPTTALTTEAGDRFSPWNRADGFRVGR